MSSPLTKLLTEQQLLELDNNNIVIEPPQLFKTIDLHGINIHLCFNYKKPRKGKTDKFVSDIITKFNGLEQHYNDMIESLIKQFPLISKDYIMEVIECYIEFPKEQAQLLIHEELEYESISIEFQLLDNVDDYPEVFPLARKKKRKIVAYLGDTNSGKTWNAMSKIADSFSSAYMAPLRLLAHETYEYLNEQGIPTSLVTGEEKIITPDSMCTSSTVECFDPMIEHDVIVIDEIQMIDDEQRGAFFIQALIGANANEVIVTGPKEYAKRLQQIGDYLNEDVEIHYFERKSTLKPLRKPTKINDIKPNTAIVAFSKREVYRIQSMLPKHIKSTVLYGALGYDVRKTQAERFRNGEVDVIVTTDCIGMGLNLPIETVLFSATSKYNGKTVEDLSVMLTKQIAGRAGRYGKFDTGYYGGLTKHDHGFVKEMVNRSLKPSINTINVLPPKRYITSLINKYNLSSILTGWQENHSFKDDSLFIACDLERQIEVAKYLEKFYPDDWKTFWNVVYCPVDFDKQYHEFHNICKMLIKDGKVVLPNPNITMMGQNGLELLLKEINLFLWFENAFPEYFEDYSNDRLMTMTMMDEVNTKLNRLLIK